MSRLIIVSPEDEDAVKAWAEPDDQVVVNIRALPGEMRIIPIPVKVVAHDNMNG